MYNVCLINKLAQIVKDLLQTELHDMFTVTSNATTLKIEGFLNGVWCLFSLFSPKKQPVPVYWICSMFSVYRQHVIFLNTFVVNVEIS